MKHFDVQAQNWDNDPAKVERAKVIADSITDFIKPDGLQTAFEFGCGTGLLSYHLKDQFKTITLADNSEGMLKVLKEKIAKESLVNFKAINNDLSNLQGLELPYDVVYTLMTLHHILELDSILKKFNSILTKGGYLCIADLVEEDGTFHSNHPDFDGHNGFEREMLSKKIEQQGFKVESYQIILNIEKTFEDKIKNYPVFLLIARKI